MAYFIDLPASAESVDTDTECCQPSASATEGGARMKNEATGTRGGENPFAAFAGILDAFTRGLDEINEWIRDLCTTRTLSRLRVNRLTDSWIRDFL